MNYSKIKTLQKSAGLTNKEMGSLFDMSETGFNKMIDKETCTVAKLESIANYFKISVSDFFDREEKEVKVYKHPDVKLDIAEDGCPFCRLKDDLIASQKDTIESQKETISALKGEYKKETPIATGT